VSEVQPQEVAQIAIEMSEIREGWQPEAFQRDVADIVHRVDGATAEEIDVGRTLMELLRICANRGLAPPAHLCLIVKALLNIDAVGRTLDPTFAPNAAIRAHATDLMGQRTLRSLSPSRLFGAMLETQQLVAALPGRLDRFTRSLADGNLVLRVDAIDEKGLLDGIEKIANRIAVSVILAALILGASLLTRVDFEGPQLWGYPMIAIVFFLIAAIGGIGLSLRMVLSDRRRRSQPGSRRPPPAA
jgi:predicted unusual protein kinase regulating ubiquinone biosynthesis (AarF/ABC1/UbiB family)